MVYLYHQKITIKLVKCQIHISADMQKVVSRPSVKNHYNVAGLRRLFDQIESSLRNLKSLKIEINSHGSLLVPLLNETS